ncbi:MULTISPECIES: hypothetical protein [unclassified Brenneria]|uniref:hypothetical protein n=1 Tax=unclassified Brenneria TaxID=2634434 RepID=UPI0029C2FD38|nr:MULTISPECIES: hypothetical protein [unclassified Brenneria]MDX5627309.1 hypothetical protein [Brenneria sp. L3-3Z]MDX5694535.1 hypothetical protein [Brenneria sp. L4-2C]
MAEFESLRHVEHKHRQDQLAVLVTVNMQDIPEAAFMRPVDGALEVGMHLGSAVNAG